MQPAEWAADLSLIRDSTALILAGALEGKGIRRWERMRAKLLDRSLAVLITDDLSVLMELGEVVIDFSAPEATLEHMRTVAHHRRAMVIGTTGFLLLNSTS